MNGDVRVRVEGLMLERLIERALAEGAAFRTIERTRAREMYFDTDAVGAQTLLRLCKRFSMPCKIVSHRGWDALARHLRRRATLLLGLAACAAVMALLLSRVWFIDIAITAGESADAHLLETALSQMGVQPGVPRSRIDADLLANRLEAAVPQFSFVGARLQGVRLLIEAAPAVPAPEIYEISGGRDLVARCDGIIESVSVLAGQACVKPGDTVSRGQVLIRGEERISKEETRPIAALGTVVARTWYEGCASTPTLQAQTVRTGRSSVSSQLRLSSFSHALVDGETYAEAETFTEILPIGGLFLPLEIQRTTAWETQTRAVSADRDALQRALRTLAFAKAAAALSAAQPENCSIAGRWIEYTLDEQGVMTARAVFETHTDIAVTHGALLQQGG